MQKVWKFDLFWEINFHLKRTAGFPSSWAKSTILCVWVRSIWRSWVTKNWWATFLQKGKLCVDWSQLSSSIFSDTFIPNSPRRGRTRIISIFSVNPNQYLGFYSNSCKRVVRFWKLLFLQRNLLDNQNQFSPTLQTP